MVLPRKPNWTCDCFPDEKCVYGFTCGFSLLRESSDVGKCSIVFQVSYTSTGDVYKENQTNSFANL